MDSRREDSQFTHRDKSRSKTDYAHVIRNNLRFVNKFLQNGKETEMTTWKRVLKIIIWLAAAVFVGYFLFTVGRV